MKKLICLIFIIGCSNHETKNSKGYDTNNVILITLDGVRWEEVFSGADPNIINNKKLVSDIAKTNETYWDNNVDVRRKKLMPFVWSTIFKNGQIYGNKLKQSNMKLTNPYFFSYPGYNELLTGFNDDSVNSNNKKYNAKGEYVLSLALIIFIISLSTLNLSPEIKFIIELLYLFAIFILFLLSNSP